jgi:hypothetical protein
MGLSGAAIGTYRPQYRPLSAIRYLDVNPLPTRYTLFSTLMGVHHRIDGLIDDRAQAKLGVREPTTLCRVCQLSWPWIHTTTLIADNSIEGMFGVLPITENLTISFF